jgi:hypothetical protein
MIEMTEAPVLSTGPRAEKEERIAILSKAVTTFVYLYA